jgi:hypothetical protein
MPRRSRRMRGGFLDSVGNTLSGWWSSAKQKVTGDTPTTNYTPPVQPIGTSSGTSSGTGMGYGGKKYKKGGYASTRLNGVASYAASVSDIKNAQPHNWVGGPEYKGGRTKRRHKHRHHKSHKHRKH